MTALVNLVLALLLLLLMYSITPTPVKFILGIVGTCVLAAIFVRVNYEKP